MAGDGRQHRIPIGHVELGTGQRGHVAVAQGDEQILPEHAAGADDEESAHSAARAFRGSHHARLSRYHCTTSARPWSKGTSGS